MSVIAKYFHTLSLFYSWCCKKRKEIRMLLNSILFERMFLFHKFRGSWKLYTYMYLDTFICIWFCIMLQHDDVVPRFITWCLHKFNILFFITSSSFYSTSFFCLNHVLHYKLFVSLFLFMGIFKWLSEKGVIFMEFLIWGHN